MITQNFFKRHAWTLTTIFVFMIVCIVYAFFASLGHHIKINGTENLLGVHISFFLGVLMVLVILLFVVILFMMFRLNNELLSPLRKLHLTISEIGITNNAGAQAGFTGSFKISDMRSMFNNLKNLVILLENINKTESFEETLKSAFSTFSEFIPYQLIGIALLSEDGKYLQAFHGISDENVINVPLGLHGQKYAVHETSLGKVIETGKPRIINDLEKYTEGRPLRDYNNQILKSGVRSSVAHVLKVNDKPLGVVFFSSVYKNVYNESHINFLGILANSIAISYNKSIQMKNIVSSSAIALAKLAESRDKDTGGHLERIKTYSKLIAQQLFFDSKYRNEITFEYIKDIEEFSPLHDIGKVAIEDKILLKPGKLTTEEFEIMKKHSEFGAMILKEAENNMEKSGKGFFIMGIEIAESHHEKWDGSGYPYSKKGDEIPLSARIVALADVFDALVSKRPYKPAYSFEEAVQMVHEGSGTHFDPEIVRVFIKNKDKIYKAYQQMK